MRYATAVFSLLMGLAIAPLAHTASPFLLPDQFDIDSDTITLQSGITNDKFFVPSRHFATDFLITNPKHQASTAVAAANFKRFSMVEIAIPDTGTYRIQTQNSATTTTDYALIDGRWLRIRPAKKTPDSPKMTAAKPDDSKAPAKTEPAKVEPPRSIVLADVPATAERRSSTIQQRADTYVSKGVPTALLHQPESGFVVRPITHPNEVFAGDDLELLVLNDGQPVADLTLDVLLGANAFDRDAKREQPSVKTDANGKVKIHLERTGVYLIATRYPAMNRDLTVAPPSHVTQYGLTLEVAP